MDNKRYKFVPVVNDSEAEANNNNEIGAEITGDSPCPCCGYMTIPNGGDALAYICPVCFWEIDSFIHSDKEASDLNHGLTLKEARKNYKSFGAAKPELKQYCRAPKNEECSK